MAKFDRLISRPTNRKEVHANLMTIANSLRNLVVQGKSNGNPLTLPEDVAREAGELSMKVHDMLDSLRAQTKEEEWL